MTEYHNSGPALSKETFEKTQRTGKAAKKLKPELKALRREIAALRRHRAVNRPAYVSKISGIKWRLNRKRDLDRAKRHSQEMDDKRGTLLLAARVARSMGYAVRPSKGRKGRISSYYLDCGNKPAIRISDHDIPQTAMRDIIAQHHGGDIFDGYHGPDIRIDQKRNKTWIRRMIVLADAGRI